MQKGGKVSAHNCESLEQSCCCVQLTALVDAANCTQVLFHSNTSKTGYEKTVLPLTQEIWHKLYSTPALSVI